MAPWGRRGRTEETVFAGFPHSGSRSYTSTQIPESAAPSEFVMAPLMPAGGVDDGSVVGEGPGDGFFFPLPFGTPGLRCAPPSLASSTAPVSDASHWDRLIEDLCVSP